MFALLCTYQWAMPHDAGSLGSYVERLVFQIFPIYGSLFVVLAWRGQFRSGLLLVLALLLVPLENVVTLVATEFWGWPGGWALGLAGFFVGAATGWLYVRIFERGRQLIARQAEAPEGDSRLGPVPSQPSSPWTSRGYLALLVASAIVILLGMKFCPASSRQLSLIFSLGMCGLGISLDSLLRPWVIQIQENTRWKEQRLKNSAGASLPSTPGGPLAARVVQILKPFESKLDLAPNIPPKKLANATREACVPADETVLGLIDCTIFGSATHCLVFGSRRIYYHNPPGDNPSTGSLAYSEFFRCHFTTSGFFDIRLDEYRSFSQAGSPLSRGKLIEVLNAIKQAVVELAGQGAEGGVGTVPSA
jgi:hypothetical protein